MLWDDSRFYVSAMLEEPHVWGTLVERDSVIYHDNDFELFIDPDGDTHEYYELEINALGTEWDLLLVKPYRDGGPAVHEWDIAGLETRLRSQLTEYLVPVAATAKPAAQHLCHLFAQRLASPQMAIDAQDLLVHLARFLETILAARHVCPLQETLRRLGVLPAARQVTGTQLQ